MKRYLVLLSAVLIIFTLCACGRNTVDNSRPEDTDNNTVDALGNPVVTPRQRSIEVVIPEPVYVELPEQAKESVNAGNPDNFGDKNTSESHEYVFLERKAANLEQEKVLTARFQDVSKQHNVIAIPAVYGGLGETITVTPGIYGQTELCALDFQILYDTSHLKYIGCNTDDPALVLNGEERGVIKANYLRIENMKQGFDLCELQFQVITAENCDSRLEIKVIEAVALDSEGEVAVCNYSLVPGVVHLNVEDR